MSFSSLLSSGLVIFFIAVSGRPTQASEDTSKSLTSQDSKIPTGQLAITVDDFIIADEPLLTLEQRDQRFLQAFEKHRVQAAAFVTTVALTPKRRKRLLKWGEAGHIIANHTHVHPNLHKVSLAEFTKDLKKADDILKDYKGFRRIFRFPGLKAGDTVKKRDGVRQALKLMNYRHGYVTIDASDWYVDQLLVQRLRENPEADVEPFRQFYLDHMWDRAQYYDQLAIKAIGRRVKHTLLIHHNLINALFLDDLIGMFKKRGWRLIDAGEALSDPIHRLQPEILPAGESIVWSLAKQKRIKGLRYPAEDAKYEKAEALKRNLL